MILVIMKVINFWISHNNYDKNIISIKKYRYH